MMQDADFVIRTDPGLFYERSDLCVWVAGLQSENVGEQLPRSGPSESANLRRKSGVALQRFAWADVLMPTYLEA